ncbi:MAG: nitrous oxide reductase family maturation protein NosD [Planctomycetes bacterium]|nr:nitrous oxide reductase family maturation protein NosD [Planctomycetota bacterium]
MLTIAGLCVGGCEPAPAVRAVVGHGASARAWPAPPRPDAVDHVVRPGDDLGAVLAAARPGERIELAAGVHPVPASGSLDIDVPVVLWGPRDAVIASGGRGSTLRVRAAGTRLAGFTVAGSGGRFDLLDAAVHVTADDVVVDGLLVRDALFGILVEKAHRVSVRGCVVRGSGDPAMGLRGDGIRLWETTASVVEGNVVEDCRDCVVWYSSHNRVVGNRVVRSRYGTHFMYSHDNLVEGNEYRDDVVGVFVMYSQDVTIRHNLMAGASGAAGIGIGLKESGNLAIEGNDLVANTTGIYSDGSPLQRDHVNRFRENRISMCDTAVGFHASPHRVVFADNDFRDNAIQVHVGAAGDALDADWTGNHFDDYRGYDLDGDGRGDVPYVLRSLSGQLQSRFPDLAFFRGSPVLAMTDVVGDAVPLFAPKPLVRDSSPRLRSPRAGETLDAR